MKQILLYLGLLIVFLFGVSLLMKKAPIKVPLKSIQVNGKKIAVTVANTNASRARGLGGTKSLGDYEGMLFTFDQKNIIAPFWMKDMIIPIDIIWIKANKIVQIDANIKTPDINTPDSALNLYSTKEGIDYVLETNANWAQKNSVKVGDGVDLSNL